MPGGYKVARAHFKRRFFGFVRFLKRARSAFPCETRSEPSPDSATWPKSVSLEVTSRTPQQP